MRALREKNVPFRQANIVNCDSMHCAAKVIPELLQRADRPDGIFAVNDETAAASMKIIQDSGLRIPNDIAVAGFTSGLISDITNPTLTSVEQHGYFVGREAVKLLIDRIEKKQDFPLQTKIIRTELSIKGSTRRG
jgi:LacI family transcriptional regulator